MKVNYFLPDVEFPLSLAQVTILIRARTAPSGFSTSWAKHSGYFTTRQAYRVLRQLEAKGLVTPYPKGGGFWKPVVSTASTHDATSDAEPIFTIRAQDRVSGDAVRAWIDLAEDAGVDRATLASAYDVAKRMDAWPVKKVADRNNSPQIAASDSRTNR